jgi:hypothetical protein
MATSIVLGRKYKDNVSGWVGVANAEYRYMNGCFRVELAASDKDGHPKSFVFDIEQVEIVPAPPVKKSRATPTGGPRDSSPVDR